MRKMIFSQLLAKHITPKKVPLTAMAEATKISRQTLVAWKKGKSNPSTRERVIACANYLQLSWLEKNELLVAAGFEPEVDPFIQNLFLELPRYHVILLLTQADWREPPYHDLSDRLFAYAKHKYNENNEKNVLHIELPSNLEVTSDNYFLKLGKQCKFNNISDADSFEYALETRLDKGRPLFLLVSCFEQGADVPREQLARIIRSATTTAPNFHVILCGGEKLADLKYKNGDMSLLNHAEVKYCPELSRSAVYTLSQHYFGNISLDFLNDTLADKFLKFSGGDTKLLTECLALKQQYPDLPLNRYPEKLSECGYIYRLFMPLIQQPSKKQKICQWLQKKELGKAEPYIQDNVLRQLYWKNLLIEREINDEKRLFWRCEAMWKGGKKICGAENNPFSSSTNGTSL